MIIDSVWNFGSQELIATISAFCTLLAVIVSLYLSRKGKVVKFKVTVNNKCCGISIYNTGHAKFNITAFGIRDGDIYYLDTDAEYSKLLSSPVKSFNNSITYQDLPIHAVSVEPGDLIESEINNFDFKILKTKNVKLFIKVNNKLKSYKIKTEKIEKNQTVDKEKFLKATKDQILQIGYYFRKI